MKTRDDYNRLKAQAHELMIADYHWVLAQRAGSLRWNATQRWLIEFVHDVSDLLRPIDEMLRPVTLQKLYQDFCQQVGIAMPRNPEKALSKLHAMEYRRNISPDCITLFYMQHIEASSSLRIIELLLLSTS